MNPQRTPIIVDTRLTQEEITEARLGLLQPTDYVTAPNPQSTSTAIPDEQVEPVNLTTVNDQAGILEKAFGKPKNRKQQRRLDHAHRVTLGMYKQELQAKETAKEKRRKKDKATRKQKARNRR